MLEVQPDLTSRAKTVFHRRKASSATNSETGDLETTFPQVNEEISVWFSFRNELADQKNRGSTAEPGQRCSPPPPRSWAALQTS